MDVLCTIVDGSLSIGGTMTLVVDQVIEATSATAIGPDQIVLSANALSNTYYTDALRNIPVGATVTVTVSAANEAWNDVQYAVGALYSLVQDGAVVSGLPSGVNPRTAVGVTSDGTVVFYTIDGRRSGHSIGASLSQVAQRMIELGCVAAIGLDGGGSTTITVTQPDDTTAATINRPSDGSERAVANHLFLVATNEPTGELGHFYVQADNAYVLAGSKVEISAAAVDTNYIPMDEDYDYDLEASDGGAGRQYPHHPRNGAVRSPSPPPAAAERLYHRLRHRGSHGRGDPGQQRHRAHHAECRHRHHHPAGRHRRLQPHLPEGGSGSLHLGGHRRHRHGG